MATPSTAGTRSRRHTAKQAIAKDQLAIQQAQQARGRRVKQLHKDVGADRGATAMAIQAIQSQNLGGLRGTPEGRQLQQEYRGRARTLTNQLPFLISGEQQQAKPDIAGFNQDIFNARFSMQQHQQDLYKAIKDQAAELAQTTAQNQATKKAGVDNAVNEALALIRRQQLANADPKTPADQKGPPIPQTEAEWMDFFNHLSTVEGVDRRSATKAVKHLQRNIARATQGASPAGRQRAMQGLPGPFR